MKFKYLIITILFFSILFVSCEANIDLRNISDEVALNPSLIVPLGGVSVTLADIVSEFENIMTDSNEIYFQNEDSVSFKFRELNLLTNGINFSTSFPISIPGNNIPPIFTIPPILVSPNLDLGLNHNPNNQLIDSLLVEEAVFTINSDQIDVDISAQNVNMSIHFPQIKMLNKGESNIINYKPRNYGIPTEITMKNFMLYTLKKTDFPAIIQLNVKTGANAVVLTSRSAFQLQMNISKISFKVAYGFFEPDETATKVEQVVLNLNKILPKGALKLSNPQIEIKTKYNIGTYLSCKVDYIKAFSNQNPSDTIYANFDGQNSTSVVFDKKPSLPGDWVTKDLKRLDKDWGGTNKLFENENKPDVLEYKFSVSTNKALIQNDPTPSFITPDAEIKINIKTKIPFKLDAGSFFEYEDSIQNIFDKIASTLDKYSQNKIDSTALILNITNGLPIKTILSINSLIDENGSELKTDFAKIFTVKSGKIDSEGIVQPGNETKQTIIIWLTNEQLNILRKAQKIRYKVKISGDDFNSNIHFNKLNSFGIKIGFFVNGTINSKFTLLN